MALTTYEDLKTAAADCLERSDLAGRAADFITLAEARLNRELRLAVMESEASLTAASAARRLGVAYARGELGLERDERRAAQLYKAAAAARRSSRSSPSSPLA